MGLNINYKEYQRNMIHQLWVQNQINSPEFSFYFSNTPGDSKIFIGNFSKNSELNFFFDKIKFCENVNIESNWGCKMESLQIKNRKIPIKSKIEVDSTSENLVITKNIFEKFFDYILEETKLNQSDCIIENSKLACRYLDINLFPDLILQIEGISLSIPLSKMIDFYFESEYPCKFKIIINEANDTENIKDNVIILGIKSIENSLFSFDIKNRKLGFYQFSENEINVFSKILKKKLNKNVYIEKIQEISNSSDFSLKFKFFIGIIAILVIIWGAANYSNHKRFNYIDNGRKSINHKNDHLDYTKLTDDNFDHFENNYFNKNKNTKENKSTNKSYFLYNLNKQNLNKEITNDFDEKIDDSRKKSYNSRKNIEMKNIIN